MFRRTSVKGMIPYLHAFSPGSSASVKGMLYRNNNANMHARLAAIQQSQRTQWEAQTFLLLLAPDQLFMSAFLFSAFAIGLVLYHRAAPFTGNMHKQKWFCGAMTEHEFYVRNEEMNKIFEAHAEQVANTRAEALTPPVFTAPEGYTSFSGRYAAKE